MESSMNTNCPDHAPPADLPLLPRLFYSTHPDFEALEAAGAPPTDKVLDVLGPPPFPKAGFPFVGFLATVYDHVTTHVRPDNGADGP